MAKHPTRFEQAGSAGDGADFLITQAHTFYHQSGNWCLSLASHGFEAVSFFTKDELADLRDWINTELEGQQ